MVRAERHGEAAAWRVIDAAVESAAALLGERLVAAYAIGSLAHGGFAPDVSDVDVAFLVDRWDEDTAATCADLAERARSRADLPLADRLSLFCCDWAQFEAPPPSARFPAIDRLDLMSTGVILHGSDEPRSKAIRPTRAAILKETAEFAGSKLTRDDTVQLLHDPARLIASGRRTLTKTVLNPVRFLYTAATGVLGSNEAAVTWYAGLDGPHAGLAREALRWRTVEVHDLRAASALLSGHLLPLYREFVDVYRHVLPEPEAIGRALRSREITD